MVAENGLVEPVEQQIVFFISAEFFSREIGLLDFPKLNQFVEYIFVDNGDKSIVSWINFLFPFEWLSWNSAVG